MRKLSFVYASSDANAAIAAALLAAAEHTIRVISEGVAAPSEIALFTPPAGSNLKGGMVKQSARVDGCAPLWAQASINKLGILSTQGHGQSKAAAAAGLTGSDFRSALFAAVSEIAARRSQGFPSGDAVLVAQQIYTQLRSQGGYFVGTEDQRMQVSPDHFIIGEDELEICQQHGPLIFQMWMEAAELYRAALGNSSLGWVAQAIEGPLSSLARSFQRQVAAFDQSLPLLARADMTNPGHSVEFQERIGGLGLVSSWIKAIRQVTGESGVIGLSGADPIVAKFAETVRRAVSETYPCVLLLCPKKYEMEQQYFADALAAYGIKAFVVGCNDFLKGHAAGLHVESNRLYYKGNQINFVYRREINAALLAETDLALPLLEAVLEGNLVVEPPLSMLFDTKVPMALAHDKRTACYFSDATRGAIPLTVFMPSDLDTPFSFGSETLTLRQTVGEAMVVKYGGPCIFYGLGARAVFNTRNEKLNDSSEGLLRGMKDVADGHTWVIQRMDMTRYPARWWDGNGGLKSASVAARLMLYYSRLNNGNLFAATSTNRPGNWKAAGNPDSILQEVRVGN